MEHESASSTRSRRAFLLGAAASVVAACSRSEEEEGRQPTATTTSGQQDPTTTTAGAQSGRGGGRATSESVDGATQPEPLSAAMFRALPVCVLSPRQGAGPFPSIERLNRRNITEGYPGHPLRLGIRVVDNRCEPIPGAQVEIWHADASGDYSSYEDNGSGKDEGEGTTFLRGFQTADDDGLVEFQTIYPGWYDGRAVHIHAMVWIDGDELLTTQLYFDEASTEVIYRTGEYLQFGPPDTPWADDPIIGDPLTDGSGIALAAAATDLGPGTLGLINLGLAAS